MPRPTFGGSKMKSTGVSVTDAAANLQAASISSTADKTLSMDSNLLAAAKSVDSKMKAPAISDTTPEMDRSVDVLPKKPNQLSSVSPNVKTLTFAESEGETPQPTSSLKKKKKSPRSSPRSEAPLTDVVTPTRPSKSKSATPLEKTVVKTPERRPAPPSSLKKSPRASEDEEAETPPKKESKEGRKLRKAKIDLENKNAGSLEEAKSKQRRSIKERESMLVDLKMPDKYESPLISASVRGDIHALESAASAYSRGGGGGDYDTLTDSAPSSTTGVAALRADGDGVTALHYAAFFHKRAAIKKLLELSIASIKAGSVLELQTLISKRQRFLEEARYAHRQAISNREDNRAKAHADAQQVKDDCVAYVSWCNNEICRVLRARELRCEERWKLCLTATDRLGRTPLMYAASTMGGDDVIKQMLTTGRAALSASAPEDMDIENFLDGGTGHDSHEQQKKSKKKEKFASSLRFVPPPCNTSKFDKMTVLTASLEKSPGISSTPLFPRDEMFHMKTGQVKVRLQAHKKSSNGTPSDSKYGRKANTRGDFTGGDPVAWLCGRLMNLTSKSNSDPARALHRMFKEQDTLGYGSLEVEDFQKLLKSKDIVADDEVVLTVCEKFRDVRNKILTAKYNELIDWTVKNCEPIKKWGAGDEEEEKEGEKEEEKDGEEAKEEEKDEEVDAFAEEKKEELENFGRKEEPTAEGFTTIADLRENRCNDVIDFTDSSGRTALHFASSIGDAISVKMLVKYGASCEKRANDNESALSYAGSRIVRSTLLNSLLSELEDAKFSVSKTQRKKLQDWIVMLGEGGLNVNDPLGGLDLHTPLHIAAIAGLKDCVDMLLEKRSSVNAGDENGWAPIHHCAVRGGSGRRAVAEKLLSDGGCKVDARTSYMRMALHLACIGAGACADLDPSEVEGGEGEDAEDIKMIELLLEWGADIEAQDGEGCTPLHRAAETGRVNCLWKIIESGANLYATTPKIWNCLHYASFNGKTSAGKLIVQRDAECGKLKSQRDSMRCTPSEVAKDEKTRQSLRNIWESAKEANVDNLVKCIIGAQNTGGRRKPWQPAGLEDQTYETGLKPLHSAILGHGMRLRRNLHGGRSEKLSADQTVQTVCLLLDKHCYVNGLDSSCRTPLHFAAIYGLVSLIDVLVSRGGEVNAEDVFRSTPLHYAYAFGRLEAAKALIKYEADEGTRNNVIVKRYESDSEAENGSDEDSDSDSDEYSSDEDEGGRRRRGRGREKGKKKRGVRKKKGRLPRECAGMGKRIFPNKR
ncbi:hypothetical protein TL16_g08323 [Triparma laevis f. inornata]|uniref:Uncharacterized protein n=1 Tax=Triparma laevis f. inornata TaxID=1714386 RepID=A0A9W7EG69_9STRA|nr:hypothetical protein TL16_g08323 [Triparma laevis f. inornata]